MFTRKPKRLLRLTHTPAPPAALRAGPLAPFHTLGGLAGVAVLAGSIAGVAVTEVDAASLYFDLLAPFKIHLLIMAAAAIGAILFARHGLKVLCAGALVSGLFPATMSWARQTPGLAGIGIYQGTGPATRLPDRQPARRIVYVNIWDENKDPARVLAFLRTLPGDIVVLAEAGAEWRAPLAGLKAQYPYQRLCGGANTSCQVAILSRIPFDAAGVERPSWRHPPIVWARFSAGLMGGEPLTVVGTHVWRPTRNPFTHRFHLAEIGAFVRRTRGPVIVAGDFNAPVWSQGMQQMMRAGGLRPSECLLPSWPVWPVNMPQFTFDNVLVSGHLSVSRIGLGSYVGSDHLPVWAEIITHPLVETRCGQ